MKRKTWHRDPFLWVGLISLITLILGGFYFISSQNRNAEQAGIGGNFAGVPIGGPYELVNQNGVTVTQAEFLGKFKLIYFGFTYCPAICPTELQKISAAMRMLPEDTRKKIQPIFITIDPERDTVDVMREYVALFSRDLIGLTGTKEQIQRAADAYRVYYAKVEDEEFADYTMDHSSYIYFMGPEDELLNIYKISDTFDIIAEDIKQRI